MRGFDLEFTAALAQRKLIGMTWPASVGGAGHSNVARLAVTEELLRAGAPVAAHWVGDRQIGPALLRHGTAELQAEILPGIVAGESVFCLGMSEPQAGSDLAAIRTLAVPTDGGFLLTGRKTWTTNAHHATHAYVLARTDRSGRKHEGLTELIVDMTAPGISVSPIVDISCEHHFNEVAFDDVFVPAHRVVGERGNGWRQVIEQLSFERGGPERVLSTYPLLASLMAQLPERDARGLRGEVGRLIAGLATLRQMCFDVALAVDRGEAPVRAAATLKLLGTEFERSVIQVARRVLGTGQASLHSQFGSALVASPGFGIRGGSSAVLLGIIAKHERSS
jgi:alkylation response protein AidB-like acyl-CoA dehydrogenase